MIPQYTSTYYFGDAPIECEFDYSPPQSGAWEGGVQIEPNWPAECWLLSATYQGLDLMDLLSETVKTAMEEQFLENYTR